MTIESKTSGDKVAAEQSFFDVRGDFQTHVGVEIYAYDKANNEAAVAYLTVEDAKRFAAELAEAIRDADNYEPEPPTFDEALGAKCDADARMDEARRLKGMV